MRPARRFALRAAAVAAFIAASAVASAVACAVACAVASAAASTGASEPVQVEFWTMSLKPKFTPYFEALVRRYEQQNPGVRLEWVDVPWDVLQTKLTAAIAGGSAPALAQMNVPWAYDYAREGAIQPVDALMGAARATYTEGALQDVTFLGRVYGFPHYNSVNVMTYNRALFAQAGIDRPPATFAEQLDDAKRIKARTGQAGFSPALGKIAGIFLEEGLPLIEGGRAVFNSPRHVAFLARLADAYKAGGLLKDKLFSEDNFPASIDAYKGGRLAMLVAPPAALLRVRDDAPDVYAQSDVAPAPVGAAGIVAGGWLFLFAMPRGIEGRQAQEAARFALYLTDAENQLAFARIAGTFPTAAAAANDAYFRSLPLDAGAFPKAVATGAGRMASVRTLYVAGIPGFEQLNKRLQDAVEGAVIGRRDIQESLDAAAAYWNRRLGAR
jgi:putative chitobiose transport system substrate-binding protein